MLFHDPIIKPHHVHPPRKPLEWLLHFLHGTETPSLDSDTFTDDDDDDNAPTNHS